MTVSVDFDVDEYKSRSEVNIKTQNTKNGEANKKNMWREYQNWKKTL